MTKKTKFRRKSLLEETGKYAVRKSASDCDASFIAGTPVFDGVQDEQAFQFSSTLDIFRTDDDPTHLQPPPSSATKLLGETCGSFRFFSKHGKVEKDGCAISNNHKGDSKILNVNPSLKSKNTETYMSFSDFSDLYVDSKNLPAGFSQIGCWDSKQTMDFGSPYSLVKSPQYLSESQIQAQNTLELNDLGLETGSFDSRSPYSIVNLSKRSAEPTSRTRWSNSFQLVLALFSLSVGIRSIAQVPIQIYFNGRGEFILAYILIMLFIVMPLMMLLSFLGQCYQAGPIGVFSMSSISYGIGIAMVLEMLVMNIYNSVSLTHSLFYLMSSFFKHPWSKLGPSVCYGAEENCIDTTKEENQDILSILDPLHNFPSPSMICDKHSRCDNDSFHVLGKPPYLYWNIVVNNNNGSKSSGGDLGQLEIILTSIFPWILIILCLSKSIRTYRACVTPIVLLAVCNLLILFGESFHVNRVVQSELFNLNWRNLMSVDLWGQAGKAAFSDSCLLTGATITLCSYRSFGSKTKFVVPLTVLSVIVVQLISYLTFCQLYSSIDPRFGSFLKDLSGGDVIFGIMPEVLKRRPCSRLSSVNFFMMIFLFELCTTLAMTETLMSSLEDACSRLRVFRKYTVAVLAFGLFAISIPLLGRSGKAVRETCHAIMEPYLVQIFALTWLLFLFFFGASRLSEAYKKLSGYRHSSFKIKVLLIFLLATFGLISTCYHFMSVHYGPLAERESWIHGLGLFLFFSIISQIPFYPLSLICKIPFRNTPALRDIIAIKPQPSHEQPGSNLVYNRTCANRQLDNASRQERKKRNLRDFTVY